MVYKKSILNWDDLIGNSDTDDEKSIKQSDERPLGGSSENMESEEVHLCDLAITLNLPRTTLFLRMLSHEQKQRYASIWHQITKLPVGVTVLHNKYTFEYCKSGQVHLHGYLQLSFPHMYYPAGVISDLVKRTKRLIGKKECFVEKYYYPQWEKYRDPLICVKRLLVTKDKENPDEYTIIDWLQYMHKDQEIK